jgi:hypothetical protein
MKRHTHPVCRSSAKETLKVSPDTNYMVLTFAPPHCICMCQWVTQQGRHESARDVPRGGGVMGVFKSAFLTLRVAKLFGVVAKQ